GPGQFHGFNLRGFLGTAERSVLLRLAAVQGQVGFDAVDQEKTLGLADLGSGDLAQRFELEPRPAERPWFGEGGERPGERLGPGEQILSGEFRQAVGEIAEAVDFLADRLFEMDSPSRSGRAAAQKDDERDQRLGMSHAELKPVIPQAPADALAGRVLHHLWSARCQALARDSRLQWSRARTASPRRNQERVGWASRTRPISATTASADSSARLPSFPVTLSGPSPRQAATKAKSSLLSGSAFSAAKSSGRIR